MQTEKLNYNRKSYTIADYYVSYKNYIEQDTVYDIPYSTFRNIVSDYFKYIQQEVIEGSKEFKLPCRLGTLCIVKRQPKNFDSKSLRIDYHESKVQGKIVYFLNEHSDYYKFRFLWSKKNSLLINKTRYQFVATRANKRRLAQIIKIRNMITLKFSEINELPVEAGIYMIQNTLNNHKYIGSTNNFKRRIIRHRSELRTNKHHSLYLQRAYNRYGEDKFTVSILEKCDSVRDTLLYLEQKYLNLKPEYNIAQVACRCNSKKVIYTNKVKHPVLQYSLSGDFIKQFDSLCQAAKSCGNKNKYVQISACCRGKLIQACGYLWKYKDDPRDISQVVKERNKGIKIDQLDLTGKYIRTYDNMAIAAKEMGSIENRSAINRVCRGQKKTAFGYKWRYHKD